MISFNSGVCSKGRTCLYNHDPKKIAICWPFLQGKCPNPDTCSLSHDPIPERTPLCVHFAKSGLCKNGESCLYPHVHVGPRNGVCRDFAVLGYCEKGIDCEQQHVRECPDFAEKGTCSNRACKLPHVIRANRGRKTATTAKKEDETKGMNVDSSLTVPSTDLSDVKETPTIYAEDGNMGVRRTGSEHQPGGRELGQVFADGKWDKGKMVRVFARLGTVGENAVRKEESSQVRSLDECMRASSHRGTGWQNRRVHNETSYWRQLGCG